MWMGGVWARSVGLEISSERDDLMEREFRMRRPSRLSPMPRRLAEVVHVLACCMYFSSACLHIVGKCSSTHKRYDEPCTSKRDVVG